MLELIFLLFFIFLVFIYSKNYLLKENFNTNTCNQQAKDKITKKIIYFIDDLIREYKDKLNIYNVYFSGTYEENNMRSTINKLKNNDSNIKKYIEAQIEFLEDNNKCKQYAFIENYNLFLQNLNDSNNPNQAIIDNLNTIIDYSQLYNDNKNFKELFKNFKEIITIIFKLNTPISNEILNKKKSYFKENKSNFNKFIKTSKYIIRDLLDKYTLDNSINDYVTNVKNTNLSLNLFCNKYRELNKPSEDKLILDKILKMKRDKKTKQISDLEKKINKLQKNMLEESIDDYNSYRLRINNDNKKMADAIKKAKVNLSNKDKIKINLV